MSRRASLPGADELFRRTSGRRQEDTSSLGDKSLDRLDDKETVPETPPSGRKGPKHDEKITFYCTKRELLALEQARLSLRAEHGIPADRGRIVRASLAYVLQDFSARGEDSVLLRELAGDG